MLSDADYMDRALLIAERGRGLTSPNPMVGAVIVSPEGVVVGTGYHRRAGEPHAEIHALEQAGARAAGATLYCTLEPCCHWGRTGPCVERVVAAGIARVVAATEDPNPLVAGGGIRYLESRGVAVEVGLGRERAFRLNRPFFTRVREGRPYVIMKAATSLDARIAAAPGERTLLTGEEANRRAHALRAEVDAIGVGSGTLLADDPRLTARGVFRERPLVRVVFDRRLRTPPAARVLATLDAGPVIVMTTDAAATMGPSRVAALEQAGATIETAVGPDFRDALLRLGELEITTLLIEGGAQLHRAAWEAGLVDQVQLYVTPRTLGPQGVPLLAGRPFSLSSLEDVRIEPCGTDILIEGYVHRPD